MPSKRNLMVTDLDQSDNSQKQQEHQKHSTPTSAEISRRQHRSAKEPKVLHTISGNFNRRSRSVDCNAMTNQRKPTVTAAPQQKQKQRDGDESRRRTTGEQRVHELLQTKETQLTKLLERVATLHNYNEQFATENQELRGEITALETRLSNCEHCEKLNRQLATSVSQNKSLIADVEMMKTLVYRLNVQIERYQDQQRTSEETGNSGQQTPPLSAYKSSLPSWVTNAPPVHTMTPLLKAYDELIADKEDLIQNYSQEFEHFTGELKRAVEENTRLLRENETLKRDVGSWREERTCLQAQLDVCRTKTEAQTRKCDLAKEKLVEVMHCYEQKTQTLMLDMDHLQAAYARCKSELAALKSAATAQQTTTPPDAIATSLQECKALLEQLKEEHSREKHKLELQIAEQTARRTDCERGCAELRQEQNALRTQLEERNQLIGQLKRRESTLEHSTEKAKRARDRLKARLRIALQWAQKLEAGQAEVQSTYDAVRRLELVVKHKEAQLRGLHERNIAELERLQQKLTQKDATIRTLLRKKLTRETPQVLPEVFAEQQQS